MRAVLCGLALLQLSCSVGSSGLSLSAGDRPLVADGTSERAITVCNTSDEPAGQVTVTLRASCGSWARATGSDPRSIEVQLTSGATCVDEVWIPPTRPGAARFEAQVGDTVWIRENVEVVAARVEAIAIRAAPPVMSDTGTSSVGISIGFTTESGGDASEGTVVALKLIDSDPRGAAALDDGPIVVGKKDSLTLIAAEGTNSVQLQAQLRGSDDEVRDCRVISPLGTPATLACPEDSER